MVNIKVLMAGQPLLSPGDEGTEKVRFGNFEVINDPEGRPLLYLVITRCPYCEHQHIHPAGHLGEPRLCPRNSRCIGAHNGAYYFPAVQQ